jgi:hypothetical protein
VTADAAVLPYRFDKVAETGTAYTSLDLPAINDSGVAAFTGTAGATRGVYFGNQFLVQQVPYAGPVTWPTVDINNPGQIAFASRVRRPANDTFDTDIIVRADPTGFTEIGGVYNGVANLNGGPAIENSGLVAWSTFGTIVSQVSGGDGAGRQVSGPSSAGTVGAPRINNAGRIAASVGSFLGSALYYNNQEIAGTTSSFRDPDYVGVGPFTVRGYDVGDNDRVVFAANWNGMTDAFYLWNNGTITKVAGTNGLTGVPFINDDGTIAGLATGPGGTRISIFNSGAEDRIISVGDPLFGSTVTALSMTSEGFNNNENIAFQATLADGRTVIAIGSLPEPGAAALIMLAGAGILTRRRR